MAGGDWSSRAVPRRDEIGQLANAILKSSIFKKNKVLLVREKNVETPDSSPCNKYLQHAIVDSLLTLGIKNTEQRRPFLTLLCV